MTNNPGPRPALRKAPDATVHPAAPVAAEAAPGVPVVAAQVERPRPAHLRPVVGLGGSTSDVLRPAPKKKGQKAAAKSTKAQRKLEKKERERNARRVDLHVQVPKNVRRDLRQNAKARGTSVDDIVTSVLEGWLDN